MLFRMIRSQTGEAGTYRAGVAYNASDNPVALKDAKSFMKAGFAEEVTAAQLKKEQVEAEKIATQSTDPADALSQKAALKAALKEAKSAKAEAEKASQAEAAVRAELETLREKIAGMEGDLATAEAALGELEQLRAQIANEQVAADKEADPTK